MRFNENLRNLRKEKEYSQEFLAEKFGVTRQTISKWENATAMPDLKKLTEIADFFGVSMDSLLGLEFESSNDNNIQDNIKENNYDNAKYQKEYAEKLFSVAYQNQCAQNLMNQKILKTVITILCITIACVILGFIFMSSNYNDSIVNLQNQVNQLASMVNINMSDDYYDDDEFEYEFLSVDKDNPYMVNAEFKYSPNTYPKNANVYFSIFNEDGTTKKIDAAEENGVFITNTAIDAAVFERAYVYIDDGEVITKEELFCGISTSDFFEVENAFDFNCSSNSSKASYSSPDSELYVRMNLKDIKIKSVSLIAEGNGREIYNEKLIFKPDTEEGRFIIDLPEFSTEKATNTIYVKIVDENGIIYKIYADVSGSFYGESYYESEYNCNEIIFADGKILKD